MKTKRENTASFFIRDYFSSLQDGMHMKIATSVNCSLLLTYLLHGGGSFLRS